MRSAESFIAKPSVSRSTFCSKPPPMPTATSVAIASRSIPRGGALRVVARAERGGERTDARHDDRRIARIGPHDDATAGGDDLLAQRFAELDVDR